MEPQVGSVTCKCASTRSLHAHSCSDIVFAIAPSNTFRRSNSEYTPFEHYRLDSPAADTVQGQPLKKKAAPNREPERTESCLNGILQAPSCWTTKGRSSPNVCECSFAS